MHAATDILPRMKRKTRDEIIDILRERGECTVNELAEVAGITPVSVRHHLTSLQAAQLVSYVQERHGVGRPRMVFSLTPKAMEQFPTRYLRLTNRLLHHLKDIVPAEKIADLMYQVANSMADEYAQSLNRLSPEARLEELQELLNEEGFSVQIDTEGKDVLIHELNCPYLQVGQEHPEICLIDETFLARALDMPVERIRCQMQGDDRCTFVVRASMLEHDHDS